MTLKKDLAVVGAGPGGYVAALRAAQLGARTALIEKKYIGGVCLNEGCLPTKALLHSAEVLTLARRAADFGVIVGEPKLDWGAVQAWKARVVQELVGGVELLLDKAGVDVLSGAAQFVSPQVVEVEMVDGQQRVEAEGFIIATGSHPSSPPVPGLEGPDVIDHTGALALETLPGSMLIIGGGAEGVEFAHAFSTYGVEVTLVEMLPGLLPLMDADLGAALEWTLGQQGAKVLTRSSVIAIESRSEGLVTAIRTPGGEQRVVVEKVLVCAGRRPNVEGLGLDAAGVRYEQSGIVVDEHLRSNVPHIYAIGDVTGGKMLAHVAFREGEVAAANALGYAERIDYKTVPSCVFAEPEVASVGLSEAEAHRQGYDVRVGKFPFSGNGKARVAGKPEGFVKIVSEATYGELLGLHVVGLHASDLILEGGIALTLEATLDDIAATVHAHPTLGEAVVEGALAATGRAIHSLKSYQ